MSPMPQALLQRLRSLQNIIGGTPSKSHGTGWKGISMMIRKLLHHQLTLIMTKTMMSVLPRSVRNRSDLMGCSFALPLLFGVNAKGGEEICMGWTQACLTLPLIASVLC